MGGITTLELAVEKGSCKDVLLQLNQREKIQKRAILQIVEESLKGNRDVATIIMHYSARSQRFLNCTIKSRDIVFWTFNKIRQKNISDNLPLYLIGKEKHRIITNFNLFIQYGALDARYDEQQTLFGSLIAIRDLFIFFSATRNYTEWRIFEIMIKKMALSNFEKSIPENLCQDGFDPISFCNDFYKIYKKYAIDSTNKLFINFKLTIEILNKIKQQSYALVKKMNVFLLKDYDFDLPPPLFIEEMYDHYLAMKHENGYIISIHGNAYKPSRRWNIIPNI